MQEVKVHDADAKEPSVPDGPGLSPIALARFFSSPRGFYTPYLEEYGDKFSVYMPGLGPIIFISRPEDHKAFFLRDQEFCEAGDDGMLAPILGEHSLLVSEGKDHKRHRQMLSPPFHGERMRAYGELMRETARGYVERWRDGDEVKLQEEMSSLTMDIIIRAVFGVDEGARFAAAHRALTQMLDAIGPFTLFVKSARIDLGNLTPWGRVKKALAAVDTILFAEIEARRQSDLDAREDILSLMLLARDEDGHALSAQEVRDELLTLLLAGHETTATALAWAGYWLAGATDASTRLVTELKTLPAAAEPDAIARLPWLAAVCHEVLRIEPIIPETGRRIKKEMPFDDMTVPVGTYVFPTIWGTHHDPQIFAEPGAFNPERFLNKTYSPFEFLPFGGGVRKCIGFAFALYEMKMVLFEMMPAVRFEVLEEEDVQPVRRNFSVGPSGGLRVRIHKR